MTEFINMWKNYVNFSDRTTVRGYWMAFLFNMIASFIFGFVVGLISGITGNTALMFLSYIYSLAVFLPALAIQIRRLRDAGKPWYYIFINFIPCVGFILYIIALCKASVPDDGTPVV